MNRTSLRLALRLHRFEIRVLAGLTVFGVALALLVCSWLDGTGLGRDCLQERYAGSLSEACLRAQTVFDDTQRGMSAMVAQAVLYAAPFLLAAMAGVALVGRELERGTARLAWSLAPSRFTWFASRLVPVLAVVAVVALTAGLALDRFSASMQPGMNPWASLHDFGNRGIDLAARVVFAFAVAVLIGAAIGRALPALLVAVVVVWLGLAGGSYLHTKILASEAVTVAGSVNDLGNLTIDYGFMAPDGRFLSWNDVQGMVPASQDPNTPWMPPYPEAQLAVPGSRYPFVVGREVAALLGGAGVALGLAFVLVRRARPGLRLVTRRVRVSVVRGSRPHALLPPLPSPGLCTPASWSPASGECSAGARPGASARGSVWGERSAGGPPERRGPPERLGRLGVATVAGVELREVRPRGDRPSA